jgi:hypothetical protein
MHHAITIITSEKIYSSILARSLLMYRCNERNVFVSKLCTESAGTKLQSVEQPKIAAPKMFLLDGGRKMIKIKTRFVALLALLVFAGAGALPEAHAQTYRGTTRVVRQLILRIENRTDVLRNTLNAQNQTRTNGTGAENINTLVQDLDTAIGHLRQNFDQRRSTTADAQEVLNRAAELDRVINSRRFRSPAVVRSWTSLRADLNQLATAYNLSWPAIGQTYPANTFPTNTTTGSVGYGANRLTGTYRLDPSQSDDPAQAADRATQSVAYANRTRLRDQLIARLQSPDEIAIELRGRDVTLASSRAPQITFTADGQERVETTGTGRTIRAKATLVGDQLTVNSTGDRESEFSVTFNPIDNGRRLSVARRVYVQGLSQPVVVQSTYTKTSDVARFDINNEQTNPNNSTTTSGTDFIIANGESVVAVIDNDLSTGTVREGDRFTATVRQPFQYEGAIIEGHVSNIQRSGRVTGRSQLTLNFDNIRLRDGRSYRFAGLLESVRTPQGDTVRIDNEGSIRDNSQTTRTAERAAIGTAVGAIIGAIAGGGKGAAIGAIVGAGGGAGSVYVQGRDDLDLLRGTELTIRATGPR